jgi:chitin disaccharide deacetylase
MKRLIVNADDLGAGESRNAGIFEAIEAGSVTSVSILPNGPALEDALRGIRALRLRRISFGVHFNISEGKPIASASRCILGPDGCFRGKGRTQSLLLGRENSELEKEIRKELSAQITLIQDAGIRVDHLDGHQHVHILPAVVRAAAEAAKAHGISWVRIPEEPCSDPGERSSRVMEEACFFSRHASAARAFYDAMGIHATDHFRGLFLKGELPAETWLDFFESTPSGLTELMVHPGRADAAASGPFAGFSTAAREKELTALTDGRFLAALLKAEVSLIPYPDIKD